MPEPRPTPSRDLAPGLAVAVLWADPQSFAPEGAFDLEPLDLDRRTLQELERVFSARLAALDNGAGCDACCDAEAHAFLAQLRNLTRTIDTGQVEPVASGPRGTGTESLVDSNDLRPRPRHAP